MTLQELVNHCKASVSVEFNPHKATYETVENYLWNFVYGSRCNSPEERIEEIGQERYERLIAGDSLVELQWYPNTPIGFYRTYGQTLEECLEQVELED